jgi:hypothetical protein
MQAQERCRFLQVFLLFGSESDFFVPGHGIKRLQIRIPFCFQSFDAGFGVGG